jgi:Predicted metal-binding, possibly nucleic acid-binding protein
MLNWDVQDVRRYKDKPFEFEEKLDLTAELKQRSSDVLDATVVEVKGQLFNDNGLVISDVKVKTTLKVPSTRSLLPVELPLDIRINEPITLITSILKNWKTIILFYQSMKRTQQSMSMSQLLIIFC